MRAFLLGMHRGNFRNRAVGAVSPICSLWVLNFEVRRSYQQSVSAGVVGGVADCGADHHLLNGQHVMIAPNSSPQ